GVDRGDGVPFAQLPLNKPFDDAPGDAAPGGRIGLEVGAVCQLQADVQQILGEEFQVAGVALDGVFCPTPRKGSIQANHQR
ncbi:MAG: hypothetical protein KA773_24705, partial [Chloroflexi bacterium]|nr:hypothetical protein [Chloroflexota bacterium]